jgi:hypothetical protein
MFMGPLIMLGISAALKQGVDHMITFLVTLSITQTLGGLAGSAVLGTFQLHREQLYSSALTSQLDPADPVVAQRLRIQQQLYAAHRSPTRCCAARRAARSWRRPRAAKPTCVASMTCSR